MRRIHVTGNAGSGKTTLARNIQDMTGLQSFGLDTVVWRSGWEKTPADVRLAQERNLVAGTSWIIEGVSETVRAAADTIVFLDVPPWQCAARCAKRNWRYLFSSRPGLPSNCPEVKIIPALVRIIFRFNRFVRPFILLDLDKYRNEKMIFHVRTAADMEIFLRTLKSDVLDQAEWAWIDSSAHMDMKPELRPSEEYDFMFAFEAKSKALGPHVAARWGWDEAYQLSIHKQRWREKPWFIILLDCIAVGTVSILDEPDCVRFGEFYILPEHQGKGIGSDVLSQVIANCDGVNRAIRLEYLKWNPVGSLYRRNGFKVVSENDTHYFMVRDANMARQTA